MTPVSSLNLARIPAGEFLMSAESPEDQRSTERVFVEEFFIGRFPVTQEEYARFVRATGHPAPRVQALPLVAANGHDQVFRELAAPYVWTMNEPPAGLSTHPVVLVRYEDCVEYCRWLSLELNREVRLPTANEWEKAARGGVDGQSYPWGNDIDRTKGNFLVDGNKSQRGTRPAGLYSPNAFGLYDMAGNVWEWVSDWQGPMRMVRGGSWVNEDVEMLRCAYRHAVPEDTYSYSIGFRIVCTG